LHQKTFFKQTIKLFFLALSFGVFCFLSACASGKTPAADAPTTLDLRGTGLTDVSSLLKKTQLTSLDLRDNEISTESFDALSVALPDCDILWSVPLGDKRFDSDTTTLSLDTASSDLPDLLKYFPALASVQLSTAPDDATANALITRYPSVQFLWDVTVLGVSYPINTETLDLSGKSADLNAISGELSRLPNLKKVIFGEDVFTLSDQIALAKTYPQIAFIWNVQLLEDLSVRSDITELDLRKYKVPDAAAFSEKLLLFPNLTRLDMCGTGPSDGEMAAMRAQYPAIKFIWFTRVSNWVIRTDIKGFSTGNRVRFPNGAGYYDSDKFSYKRIRSTDFENLKYCTDLIALDIGHSSRVGNVEFLKYLPQLQYLDIALCDLTDISPLENLPNLVYLQMMYNYVEDITPLKNCTKLRFLNASDNNLNAADTLLGMPELERLWINCSGLSDEQIAALSSALTSALPNIVIKASQDNPEYAMSAWCKGNEGYVTVQALYGLRAKFQ